MAAPATESGEKAVMNVAKIFFRAAAWLRGKTFSYRAELKQARSGFRKFAFTNENHYHLLQVERRAENGDTKSGGRVVIATCGARACAAHMATGGFC
ncbi:MAG: hypothetical protein NVV73_11465 [Cellvibrionaceae bacterium]|nr:hypothetical protein [Cellvibrionaceae bacterium]